MFETFAIARARFEAARSVPHGAEPRLARRHGHGFVVDARAAGTAAETLAAALATAVEPLDYADLDGRLADPSDAGLAAWLGEQLSGRGLERLVVSPTPGRRLEWSPTAAPVVARRHGFEAAHFLPNVPAGHQCGRLHGHSFEVLVRATGTDGVAIDRAWAPWAERLGHVCLNDLDGLDNPTSERLSRWLWERLGEALPTLVSVTVYETGRCGATYDGATHTIWRAFTFDAAVRRDDVPAGDPRRRVHGHTYGLRLHLRAPLDTVLGWAMDFGDVQRLFAPVYALIDHRPLCELEGLTTPAPAALAAWIGARAGAILPALSRIDLEETPGHGVLLAPPGDLVYPV